MKRMIVGALCGALLACLGSWLEGYNFNERGPRALMTLMLVICMSVVGASVAGVVNTLLQSK